MVLNALARQNANMVIACIISAGQQALVAAIIIATAARLAAVLIIRLMKRPVARIAGRARIQMDQSAHLLLNAPAVIAFGALAGRQRFTAAIIIAIMARLAHLVPAIAAPARL